ncbi:MAG: head decoration protein [Zoogloeaceae bacterium]|jgi:hypothetical protein|nr:head decoration protein [Zoogloeaceae bacterium]
MNDEILQEGSHTAEFLLSEGNGEISREEVLIKSGAVYSAGQVLGIVTATGKYAAYDNSDSTTGLGVAAGVLYAPVDAADADQKATVIVRLAEVVQSLLVGLDDAAKADLLLRNIIVR